jgi:hypothetical protein
LNSREKSFKWNKERSKLDKFKNSSDARDPVGSLVLSRVSGMRGHSEGSREGERILQISNSKDYNT